MEPGKKGHITRPYDLLIFVEKQNMPQVDNNKCHLFFNKKALIVISNPSVQKAANYCFTEKCVKLQFLFLLPPHF